MLLNNGQRILMWREHSRNWANKREKKSLVLLRASTHLFVWPQMDMPAAQFLYLYFPGIQLTLTSKANKKKGKSQSTHGLSERSYFVDRLKWLKEEKKQWLDCSFQVAHMIYSHKEILTWRTKYFCKKIVQRALRCLPAVFSSHFKCATPFWFPDGHADSHTWLLRLRICWQSQFPVRMFIRAVRLSSSLFVLYRDVISMDKLGS